MKMIPPFWRNTANRQSIDLPKVILFSASASATYHRTVAAHPPETCAMLGGSPNDRSRVTEVRFLPAAKNDDGSRDAGGSHFQPDNDFLNFILTKEWLTADIVPLGYIHSHPGQMRELSRGAPGSSVGDIAAIKSDMAHAEKSGIPWPFAVMPITTFDDDGRDTVTGWIVTPDDPEPFAAEVVFENAGENAPIIPQEDGQFPIDAIAARLEHYQRHIAHFLQLDVPPAQDSEYAATLFRQLMRSELDTYVARLTRLP